VIRKKLSIAELMLATSEMDIIWPAALEGMACEVRPLQRRWRRPEGWTTGRKRLSCSRGRRGKARQDYATTYSRMKAAT